MSISAHVLDATSGLPAAGEPVELARRQGAGWAVLAGATVDADGQTAGFAAPQLGPGGYRLTFEIEGHITEETFYPQVVVVFRVTAPAGHDHVPVLLSPFSCTTYRGS
jgi:5-hydroxyisourate hydrolase